MSNASGSLAGKTALVTGAASGLGEAIARRLAADGATVIVADLDAAAGKAVTADLPGTPLFLKLDVTQGSDWLSVLDAIDRRYGALQILVNNAGITLMGSIEALSLESWQKMLDVDLTGVFLGCKHALPLMRKTGGSIVNISSASGIKASPDLVGYNAAKAGVTLLTKSVALHCARERYGIRCNSVHPGAIHTPILDKVMSQVADPETLMAGFIAGHPIGYLGEPSDIAEIVAYLASDASRFSTGASFIVDGGMSL